MAGLSSVGGLISGIDTAAVIDDLIAVSRKRIDIVVGDQTDKQDKLDAYTSLNSQLSSFQAAADTLRDSDTFDVYNTSASTDSSIYDADELITATATEDATPGTHTIEFTSTSQLAKAEQLSSKSYSSLTSTLGFSADVEFVINGQAIKISSTDSLSDLAGSINNANTGSDATGVTATLISVTSTDHRLILTSDSTGEDQFYILDASSSTSGDTDILQTLGFVDSTISIKNTTSDGAESDEFSSASASIKSLLGLSTGQSSGNISIGGTSVTIDLASDSITDIASAIDAVTGVSASVVSTITDGVTTFHLDISGTTSFTDENNILEALGVLVGDQNSVAEVHAAATEYDNLSAAAITASTAFNDIDTDTSASVSNDVTASDTITITGTDHDGISVSGTYIISNTTTSTMDDLLTEIETVFGGAGDVTVSISSSGQIVITDLQTGDSQITASIIANNEGGGTLDFGMVSASTEGYSMEVTAGQNAKLKVDGIAISRTSNSIDDIISGVTLDLATVESGATVNLTISRNTDSIKDSVNEFISAYNDILEFINQEFTYNEDTEGSGVLGGESTLSSIKSIIQSVITSTIKGLSSGENAISLIGITSDKDGKLSMDESEFVSAINSDYNIVKRLFIAEGSTTDSDITYVNHKRETVAGTYDVHINTAASQATVTGTTDISAGIGANTETMTITDTRTGRVATISLDGNTGGNATTLSDTVNAINSELANEYTEIIVGDYANADISATTITSSTVFGDIDTSASGSLTNDIVNDDVISYTGTTRSGVSISDTFTITDTATTTVQDFLSAIEASFGNLVSASINTSGIIEITDVTAGNSNITLIIDGSDAGSLNFGTVSVSTEGRYAMEITASGSGNNLVLTHDSYGISHGYSIAQTTDYTGISDATDILGVDVAGTINGEAATGSGQLLTGDTPDSGESTSIENLSILVGSTASDSDEGTVTLTMGVAEQMYFNLDDFIDAFDGFLTVRMDGLQDSIDNLQDSIDGMEVRLLQERTGLETQFTNMELALARIQTVSSFLAQQFR